MSWFGYPTGIRIDVVIENVKNLYVAYVPHIPECTSFGETPEEAVENLKEVIENYLDLDFDIGLSISSASAKTRSIAG